MLPRTLRVLIAGAILLAPTAGMASGYWLGKCYGLGPLVVTDFGLTDYGFCIAVRNVGVQTVVRWHATVTYDDANAGPTDNVFTWHIKQYDDALDNCVRFRPGKSPTAVGRIDRVELADGTVILPTPTPSPPPPPPGAPIALESCKAEYSFRRHAHFDKLDVFYKNVATVPVQHVELSLTLPSGVHMFVDDGKVDPGRSVERHLTPSPSMNDQDTKTGTDYCQIDKVVLAGGQTWTRGGNP